MLRDIHILRNISGKGSFLKPIPFRNFLVLLAKASKLCSMKDGAKNFDTAEEEPILVPGKKSKRILACLGDFFLMLVLEMILYTVFASIASQAPIAQEAGNQIVLLNQEANSSGLRLYDAKGNAYSDDDLQEIYLSKVASYDGEGKPDDCFYNYYCVYESDSKAKMDVDAYNAEILGLGKEGCLFVSLGEGKAAMLQEGTKALVKRYLSNETDNADVVNAARSVKEFYAKTYETAWKSFAENGVYAKLLQAYTNAATKQYVFFGCLALVSYLIAGGAFYFLIPLIKGSGKAIGKRVMHLEPLESDGSPLKGTSLFLRGSLEFLQGTFAIPFAPFFIYGLDGFMLPFLIIQGTVLRLALFMAFGGIIGLVSLGFMIFRKDGSSLTELLSKTIVCTTDMAAIRNERDKRLAERKSEQ